MNIASVGGRELPARIVFGRSLQYFHDLAVKTISDRAGVRCYESEIKWILTVPAIWGDRAKEFMKCAAEEVGTCRMDISQI